MPLTYELSGTVTLGSRAFCDVCIPCSKPAQKDERFRTRNTPLARQCRPRHAQTHPARFPTELDLSLDQNFTASALSPGDGPTSMFASFRYEQAMGFYAFLSMG
jgi:hypothetical protein